MFVFYVQLITCVSDNSKETLIKSHDDCFKLFACYVPSILRDPIRRPI